MTLFTDLLSPRNENLIFFLYIVLNKKRKKLTGPNKVLLVLGRRTTGHREDCILDSNFKIYYSFYFTVGDVTYVELFENTQGKSKGQG
jgi:hypothetical protein